MDSPSSGEGPVTGSFIQGKETAGKVKREEHFWSTERSLRFETFLHNKKIFSSQ
jgi:hypothetical protein